MVRDSLPVALRPKSGWSAACKSPRRRPPHAHRVLARAPRQPSEISRDHFPIVQVCSTLSATQKPAPSLKESAGPHAAVGRQRNHDGHGVEHRCRKRRRLLGVGRAKQQRTDRDRSEQHHHGSSPSLGDGSVERSRLDDDQGQAATRPTARHEARLLEAGSLEANSPGLPLSPCVPGVRAIRGRAHGNAVNRQFRPIRNRSSFSPTSRVATRPAGAKMVGVTEIARGAEVGVQIFELHRDTRDDGVLETNARHPARSVVRFAHTLPSAGTHISTLIPAKAAPAVT